MLNLKINSFNVMFIGYYRYKENKLMKGVVNSIFIKLSSNFLSIFSNRFTNEILKTVLSKLKVT